MANMTTSIVMELVDRVTRPVRRIQQSLSGLGRRAGLDRLAGSARRVGNAMNGVIERVKGLGQRLAVMGGLAAGAVWGVERLVSGVTDVGTSVQESAERLSVGTTWLQEWMAVGKKFGVQNDALVDGLKELGLRADEFVMTGGGPAEEAFSRLGIGIRELRATAGDTESLLDLVMGRLGDIENESARQRIFDELFGGQGGEQLVAMLSTSREELEKMMRAAHERGEILSPEEIENSREYNRQMGDLQASLFGIQRTVVGDLLPAITDWIERMRELASANREAVSERILEGLRDFWSGLKEVGRVVSWLSERVGGFGNLLLWTVGILAVPLVGALASAATAILGFAGTLLLTPIGWFVGGIALVAGAAYLIYRNWDGIGRWFEDRWGDVQSAFDAGIGGISRLLMDWSPLGLLYRGITATLETLGVDVPDRFETLGGLIIDGLWAGLKDAWSSVTSWVRERVGALGELFGGFSLLETAGEWVDGLQQGLQDTWSSLTGWVDERIAALGELFSDFSLSEIGGQWIDSLKAGIAAQWEGLTNWLSAKLETLTGWLPDWAKEGLGIETVAPPVTGSPEAALGAPVAENRQAAMTGTTYTDVGGELRIVVDSEGRTRVAEARRNGGLDFSVESGLLGVMP